MTRTRVRSKARYAHASLQRMRVPVDFFHVQHNAGTVGMNTRQCLVLRPCAAPGENVGSLAVRLCPTVVGERIHVLR